MTADMMTPLCFKISEAAMIRAAWLNASRYNARIALFTLVVALAVSGIFIAQGHHQSIGLMLLQISLTVSGACLIAVIVVWLIRLIVLPMQVRKNLRQQKALSEEMQLSWTQDAFCYAAGQSRTVMAFTDLHGFKVSEDVMLLYHSDFLYNLILTDAFGDIGLRESFIERLVDAGIRRL